MDGDSAGTFVYCDCLVVVDNLYIGGEGGAIMFVVAEDEAGEETYAEKYGKYAAENKCAAG